jgi:hypothetical protein
MTNKEPQSLMDIVDEAFDLVDNRIDSLRDLLARLGRTFGATENQIRNEMVFLEDLRALLRMGENFRDNEK